MQPAKVLALMTPDLPGSREGGQPDACDSTFVRDGHQ